jgi:aromatic ring-opening dioxygenase catalytic subunit (LigB family)
MASMTEIRRPQTQSAFAIDGLRPSARMPVLFIGHGSPMNAIEDNPFRRSWEALGQRFGKDWHPSFEHFLPLFYAIGATQAGDRPKFFNDQFQLGAISMRSVVWD